MAEGVRNVTAPNPCILDHFLAPRVQLVQLSRTLYFAMLIKVW